MVFKMFTKNNYLVDPLVFEAEQPTYIFVINTLHENKLPVSSFSVGLILKWSA